ncbi:MAG: hypothetical protein ACTHMS_04910 [Jatrophihabitans sp.]|uniref:hypothetical protein n=1 Tax=Jatrophihabitans sp. TaxID=1932789 RepID=UPI003F7EE77C
MRRRFVAAPSIVALTVLALAVLISSSASAGDAGGHPSVLVAGQQLVALTANDVLASPSGEFQLKLSPDFLALWDYVRIGTATEPDFAGTGIWFRDDGTGLHQSNTDRSILRLRRDGNLVLMTSRGVILWTSGTRGSGTRNRLTLRDSGDLVMTTAEGRRVWATNTTRVYLGPRQRLLPGQRMYSRWADQQSRSRDLERLVMQPDGDLVLRNDECVHWHTRTHRAGSSLLMRPDGNLVIVGPHGRTIWSTHTGGAGPYTFFDALRLEVHDESGGKGTIWRASLRYPAPCVA